jgi:peptide/nickel transport system permease protein
MVKKILQNPQAVIGLSFILLVLAAAVLAPALAPHDPEAVNVVNKFARPGGEYPLGTDQLGRCELSRLLYGARYSIGMSLPTILVLSVLGLLLGSFSACAGKRADQILIVVCDIFIAFPALVIAAAVIGVLGDGMQNIVIAIVIAMWAWFTRVVRSYTVVEMGRDYILAARISGCGTLQIILRHLIPNIIPQFLVYVSTGVASAILMVSGFSFLNLGLPAGVSEWGAMLNEARSSLYSHPEFLIYPGVCILITAAGFNLFGEALRDMLEPEEGAANAAQCG